MKQYSQHGEDTFLWNHIHNSKKKFNKVIVDIGALDGIINSNSRLFLEDGWKGVLFEPNKKSFSKLLVNNNNFDNDLFNIAVSDKDCFVNFTENKRIAGHSKIDGTGDNTVFSISGEHLKRYGQIGILDIDTEGKDFDVLHSIVSVGIKPQYIIIESNTKELKNKIVKYLNGEGYKLINTLKVNTIWELS